MIPEEKAVRNMWVFFLVKAATNTYTLIDNHKIAAQGS
jgi:hypothetical protein